MSSSQQYDTDFDALRAHLSREMCRMRQRAGLSRDRLAAALGCTPQWLYKLEKTDKALPEQMAWDLDTYFKTDGWEDEDGHFHRIYAAIRRAGRHRVVRPSFEDFVRYEAKAVSVRCFAAQIVPGLLQTEDYARGVMDPNEPLEVQEARVMGRMERQSILTGDKPPTAMFVLDESVLRRPIGGAKVMVDQIDHLIGLARSPGVQVRLMLFERIASVALGGGFILLSFEDDTDLIYIESGGVSQLLDDRDRVFKAGMDFNTLMGEALSHAESIELLNRTREEYL